MSPEMTTASSSQVEEYCEAVRVALEDLPVELRDDLLEDLPYHLREVLAEGDDTLRDRLGEPAQYAEELRAAAGLESGNASSTPRRHLEFAEKLRRLAELADRADARLGAVVGYPRVTHLVRAVQPGWWVLRGWLIAVLIFGTDRNTWRGVLPTPGGSRLIGVCLVVVAVVASVWVGRRTQGLAVLPRRVIALASLVIAVWGGAVVASQIGTTSYVYDSSYSDVGSPADVYVYDQNGNLVSGARLYNQNGDPLQLGDGTCPDGTEAPGTDPSYYDAGGTGTPAWTYPVCPAAPGPFRSGPGAVTAPSTAGPSTTEPATTEPATTEPATTEPSTSAPSDVTPSAAAPSGASAPATPSADAATSASTPAPTPKPTKTR